ncbi:hypothetical protein WME75_04745 [Sorangium sp. So ce1014]|uniref:hypothetical protein n=1 Tax=Sorangium sp. So ce1014 TaxID=3133326 RepID=UPI003F5F274E
MTFRDPTFRMKLTFPGLPVTRRVSPADIEAYVALRGYTPTVSIERDWPEHISNVWLPPQWPDPRAPQFPGASGEGMLAGVAARRPRCRDLLLLRDASICR